MSFTLAPTIRQRYFSANGAPLAGGKLYTYQAGTTTPQATYTDSGGLTANANPVILDANGEANVWFDVALSYKCVLKDSLDVTQWTVDNMIGLLTNNSVVTASIQDGSVTTPKIAAGAITSTKMGVNSVANTSLAQMATSTIKGRVTALTGDPEDLTVTQVKTLLYTAPTVQKFLSGASNYTTPANVKYIKVTIVGAGGGGGGGAGWGSGGGGAGGAGGNTTFGTSLLTANGGSGGGTNGGQGGAGGAASVAGSATQLFAIAGGSGNGGGANSANVDAFMPGGRGADSMFGGGGGGGTYNQAGQAATSNSGGGGGGGAGTTAANNYTGAGGGSGGAVGAIIAPTASQVFAYSVGAAGTAGAAGATGYAGGAGGSGVIIVEEYYQ